MIHRSSLLATSRIQIRPNPLTEEAIWAGSISLAIVTLMAIFPVLFGAYVGMGANGPLNVIQLICFGLGFGYMATKGVDRERDRPALYLGAIALLTLSLSQIDLHPTQARTWLILLVHDLRDLWLIPTWAIVVINAYRNRIQIQEWLQVQPILAVKQVGGIAVTSLILAQAFQLRILTNNPAVATFWKEVFELVLAATLLVIAIALTQRSSIGTIDQRRWSVRSLN